MQFLAYSDINFNKCFFTDSNKILCICS